MLTKYLKYILIHALTIFLSACSMEATLKSITPLAEGSGSKVSLSVKNYALFQGSSATLDVNSEARVITLSNVPAGRIYSLTFEEDGALISTTNDLQCEAGSWVQQLFGVNVEFGKTTPSSLHLDLSLRNTNGTLRITCSTPAGGDFDVVVNYLGSANSVVSSSMDLVPGGERVVTTFGRSSADGTVFVWVQMGANAQNQVVGKNTQTGKEFIVSSKSQSLLDAGNAHSLNPVISADGRYVAFVSSATNFVLGANGNVAVYVKDLQNLDREPVMISSLDSTQTDQTNYQGIAHSGEPSISSDGRYILFQSGSANFSGGVSGTTQLYRKDLQSLQSPPLIISSLDSTQADQTNFVGNGYVHSSSMSGDGRYIVFSSRAENFVVGTNTGSVIHTYLKDTSSLAMAPILISSLDSTQADQTTYHSDVDSFSPSISGNGRYIVFTSFSTNFGASGGYGQIYLKDRLNLNQAPILISSLDSTQSNQTTYQGDGTSESSSISDDGRYIVFNSYASRFSGSFLSQVYMKDRQNLNVPPKIVSSRDSTQVSQGNYAGNFGSEYAFISGNGRYVLFVSGASNFVLGTSGNRLFKKDLQNLAAAPTLAADLQMNGFGVLPAAMLGSERPMVSEDGRYVFFISASTDLHKGATNSNMLYRRDLHNLHQRPVLISSLDSTKEIQTNYAANSLVVSYSISKDGRYVVFVSNATNLANVSGGFDQVFFKDLSSLSSAPILISSKDSTQASQVGYHANGGCANPSISDDGRYVVFICNATNLVTGVASAGNQIYMKDMQRLNQPPTLISSKNSLAADQTAEKGVGSSSAPRISGNGEKVVFVSAATNFVSGGSGSQIYVKDLLNLGAPPVIVSSKDSTQASQTTQRGNGTSSNPHISSNGRYVVFISTSSNFYSTSIGGSHVYYKDLNLPAVRPYIVSSNDSTLANQNGGAKGNGNSDDPLVSSDGRYVVFVSSSNNFVIGTIYDQIYIKDMNNMTVPPVILSTKDRTQSDQTNYQSLAGISGRPGVSPDMKHLVYSSSSINLVDVYSYNSQVYYLNTGY